MTQASAPARALWIEAAGRAVLRPAPAAAPGAGEVTVATRHTGISRGTERLVFAGAVPRSERERMRAPFQEGGFEFPVKYGYAAVGEVVDGDPRLLGRHVFCLHPHQSRFTVPADAVVELPGELPPKRAVLGANMETALNVVWDAGAAPGDRIAVVGAGVVGALVGWLCARLPGAETTLVDVDESRAELAAALGTGFAAPADAPADCDVVVHASASGDGLATALGAAGVEGRVVEASWYGDRPVAAGLGEAFHSRRLTLVSSQVGAVAASHRPRWTHRRRLAKALELLRDPELEILLSGATAFDDLPGAYARILAAPDTLCHRVDYA